MLLRLSRLSLWLAAAAAGMAFFGPVESRGLYADTALALAGAAFVLWRGAVALLRRLQRPIDAVPAPHPLDADALREGALELARAAREAPNLEAALLEVAQLLRGEIGAREVRVFMIDEHDGAPELSELIAVRPGFRAPRRPVAPGDSMVGRALRELRACVDLPRGVALPIVHGGKALALLELTGIEMAIEDEALGSVLGTAAAVLGECVERDAAMRPALRVGALALRGAAAGWRVDALSAPMGCRA